MTAPAITKQQKDLMNWLRLRSKSAVAAAANAMKDAKKSST
jgi:hypothetical protein